MELTASSRCFKSDLYKDQRVLSVGVKQYIPGVTIDNEHPFVTKLHNWTTTYTSLSREQMTPGILREHPGNPLAVIEGKDGNDYVITDKNEGGKHFQDEYARKLSNDLLWDLGEGLVESMPGLPVDYFKNVIMLPMDENDTGCGYDVSEYQTAYERQNATRVARGQLPSDIKGTSLEDVTKEIMTSAMVVKSLRKMLGYDRCSTDYRFNNVPEKYIRGMLSADRNHLSGVDAVSLSPLFIRRIKRPETERKQNGAIVTMTRFDYGFGKLFDDKNIVTRGCRLSKFSLGNNVKCFRCIGMGCQSFVGVAGTYVLDGDEKTERQNILVDNQDYRAQKMKNAGKEPFDKHTVYATGHSDLVFSREKSESSGVARFQLFTKSVIDHTKIIPFVLMCQMIKSELVMYLTLVRLFFYQLRDPTSFWYAGPDMAPGDATVSVYRRLVETLYPCEAWWKNGAIRSGKRWKLASLSLFSNKTTLLALTMANIKQVLWIEDTDERTQKKMMCIEEAASNKGSHYNFIPVMNSTDLVFTKDDRTFVTNNCNMVLSEEKVKKIFGLRKERERGLLPPAIVSAVTSLQVYQKISEPPTQGRLTADLVQPCTNLTKAETIRVFTLDKDESEEKLNHNEKISGYLDALEVLADKDGETLTLDNAKDYLSRLHVPEDEQKDVLCVLEKKVATEKENESRDAEDGEPSSKKIKYCDD